MTDKTQTFLVTVAILEGRHYVLMNMDSAVIVKVDNKKRCTSVRYNTESPFYNEYFVFEFSTSYEKIINKNITITVIQPRSFSRRRKILGYFTVDIATVWAQKNHQFYHKWAILNTTKSDTYSGPRGYIKVDISVLAKGEVPKIPVHIINDEIEGNLLLPEGSQNERLRATYIFDVFRCEYLVEKPSTAVSDDPLNNNKLSGPNTYIEITFAGIKVRTSTKKSTCFPVFNERLKITDLFPPLCQRIKIEMCQGDCLKKRTTKMINLKLISSDKEEGFLPTFGPTFLHMYFSNVLEGYAGSILMAMHTELQELAPTDMKKAAVVEPISPLIEEHHLNYEEVLLFANIFEATAIQKKYCEKMISFRITFGGILIQNYVATSGESPLMNATLPQKPIKTSKQYCSVNFGDMKPTMIIDIKFPYFRRRIFNVNILSKIARDLKTNLDKIEEMFERQLHRTSPGDIDILLIQSLDIIATAGRKYVDIVSEYNLDLGTDLDKERKCMCIKEMVSILQDIQTVYNNKSRKKTFGKLQNTYRKIETLMADIQDCWPDVFMWMLCGNKKVACFQVPARDLAFSPIADEIGYMCGVKKSIYLCPNQKDQTNISCRMEVMFWLGLNKHKNAYLHSIPQGFKLQNDSMLLSRSLKAEEKYIFNLKAYVFQGKISSGFDKSGLADAFVRVLVSNQQKETLTIKASLSPVWNEMLIFNDIVQYGSKAYLKNNILLVQVEVFDKDNCGRTELVGRCSVKPVIKFIEDIKPSSKQKPILHWHRLFRNNDNLGEVLAAFELIEASAMTKEGEIAQGEDHFEEGNKTDHRMSGDSAAKKVRIEKEGEGGIEAGTEKGTEGGRGEGDKGAEEVKPEKVKVGEGKQEDKPKPKDEVIHIPQGLKPTVESYRIEVLFWGMRELRKVNYVQINRPRISIICGEQVLLSDTIENAKKNSNFPTQSKSLDVEIPSQREYVPPLCMKLHDSRRFGVYTYAGVHVTSISKFLFQPMTAEDRTKYVSGGVYISFDSIPSAASSIVCPRVNCPKIVQLGTSKSRSSKVTLSEKNDGACWLVRCIRRLCKKSRNFKGKSASSMGTYELLPQDDSEVDDFDWWTKFYDSLDKYRSSGNSGKNAVAERPTLKIYPSELERQPQFRALNDMLSTFEMYKGKRTGDEAVDEENITALFKGAIRIYRWPPKDDIKYVTPSGLPLADGIFQSFPQNQPIKYLLRVYCVRAIGLRPSDLNGKSDPYLCLTLNDKCVNDKENKAVRQVDPIFGRCFEFNACFPNDHMLVIAVWDYDKLSADDLIGETKIDLEGRFYSKHRASCGIPEEYYDSGYCEWHDQYKPTAILQELCKKWNVDPPEYRETSVCIGFKEFSTPYFIPSTNPNYDMEVLALTVLRRWNEMPVVGCHLVPEHVETRSLYNSSKPGIEQGKIQLWVDMFPVVDLPPPKQVIISPRQPTSYELRVIIWNTDDVALDEDDFFLGEKKSDIYVKGWTIDSADAQYTDVHYRSLTGEGNFNWRFIFRFDYLSTENKVIFYKKDSVFASEATEYKQPCKLNLQVWDNDTLSSDDFLGTLTLELSKMPRGARVSEKCNLSIVEPHAPTINLFKIRRTKGWWPFKSVDPKSRMEILTGKLECELEIVTVEEANKSPAGLGRKEPQALAPPCRPDVSFSWFRNPLKGLKYMCKLHRCKCLTLLFMIMLVLFVLIFVYNMPGYAVKRLMGA